MVTKIHVHTPLLNLMHMTECLCPLYCLVQSPNSVTQHLAELSAEPEYISRLTTTIQITALVCPSIVCNRQLTRVTVLSLVLKVHFTHTKALQMLPFRYRRVIDRVPPSKILASPPASGNQDRLLLSTDAE